jgi:hypothetical protein
MELMEQGMKMRKLVASAVSAALCLASVTPAFAQNYRPVGFDAPRGATATANLRIPLGRQAKAKPTYGLSFGIGKSVGSGIDGRPISRQLTIADLRFSGKGELARASFTGFDLADPDRSKRLNMMGGGDSGLVTIVAVAAAGAVVCFVITDCFGDDDDDDAVPNN